MLQRAEGARSCFGAGFRALRPRALMPRLLCPGWTLRECGLSWPQHVREGGREGGGKQARAGILSLWLLGSCVDLWAPRGRADVCRASWGSGGASQLGVPSHAYCWEGVNICAPEEFSKMF